MQVLDEGHLYAVESGQQIQFIKHSNGELVKPGTTNEELLEVLINRTKFLDDKVPCDENKVALQFMSIALKAFNSRTTKCVAQGVETKDLTHVS